MPACHLTRPAIACRHGAAALLAVSLAALSACGGAVADLRSLDQEEFIRHLEERIPNEMNALSVPGFVVLIVRDGVPVWSQAWGWADRDRKRRLATSTTMLTHSISKSVTAWSVMKLVEDGLIALDDPASIHLAGAALPAGALDDSVTIRHLLSHSSGLPLGPLGVHYSPDVPLPPLNERVASGLTRERRPPGSGYEYSNLGFGVLQLIVQEVTGQSFEKYVEETVLHPLGMHGATFAWRKELHGDVPMEYDLRGRPIPPYLYPYAASGGLFATVHDVGRFIAAGAENAALSAASLEEMYTAQAPLAGVYALVSESYGLGHFVERLPGGHAAVWHGGQGQGSITHYHYVPATGDGIVILSNSSRSWPLIAAVLNDWAGWRGLGSPGMGRIARAGTVLHWAVVVLAAIALWWTLAVARDLIAGNRRATLVGAGWKLRVIQMAFAIVLLALLSWSVMQEYLFVTSVFPATATSLALTLLGLACASVLSAAFPRARHAGAAALALVALSLTLPASSAQAQETPPVPQSQEPASVPQAQETPSVPQPQEPASVPHTESDTDATTWAVLPFLAYTPETGVLGGALAGYYWRLAPDAPLSNFLASVTITEHRQLIIEWLPDAYLANGIRVAGELTFSHFPDVFAGIGPRTSGSLEEDYTGRMFGGAARVLRPVGGPVRLGVAAMARHERITSVEDHGLLAGGTVAGSDGSTVTGLGVIATWDTRDNIFSSRRGSYVEAVWTVHDGALGSDFDFHRVAVDVRHFRLAGGSTILALNANLNATSGTLPFTLLPPLGGPTLMRGYRKGRYRDRVMLTGQAELRFSLWRRFGGAVFVAAGDVAPRIDELDPSSFLTTAGAGIRYRWTAEGVVLRGDYGVGREGGQLYLTLGQAF